MAITTPAGPRCLRYADVDAVRNSVIADAERAAQPAIDAAERDVFGVTLDDLRRLRSERDRIRANAIVEQDRELAPPGAKQICWGFHECGFDAGSGAIIYHRHTYQLPDDPPPCWHCK